MEGVKVKVAAGLVTDPVMGGLQQGGGIKVCAWTTTTADARMVAMDRMMKMSIGCKVTNV